MSKSSPSRAQRRVAAKSEKAGRPVPVPQGPRQPHDSAFLQRVQGMLRGEVEPPNEYVTYQLGQLRESQAEFEALQRNVQNAEAQLQQLRVELQRADGRIDARLGDIRIWCDMPQPGAAPAPEAPAAPEGETYAEPARPRPEPVAAAN